jgi:lysophospholipase L1-like esterase
MSQGYSPRRAALFLTAATAVLFAASPTFAQTSAKAAASAPAMIAPAALSAAPDAARPARTPSCVISAEQARFDFPLARMARRLVAGLPIKIVAIGSSSTFGAGASSPAASYPSRLADELSKQFRGHEITVLNRGVNGEVATDMLARFQTGVIGEKPHLVLWQVGTNSVLRDHPVAPHRPLLHVGIEQLKAIGADIVLIDPQYAPRVIAKPNAEAMVELLATIAKEEKVDLFRRFALMRHWHDAQGLAFNRFLSPDELHMNDWSYACVARGLGNAIAEAATRPTATAAAPSQSPTR